MHALHLFGTAVWVGGLAALLVWLLTAGKGELSQGAAGRFSNLARVAVFALAVSGAYAAWLHVGSAEALTGTLYGRALGVKMLLFAPVLALAAVNLVWTARRSRAGAGVWHGRLRASVGAELALLAGVLVSAGVLTSGSPARPIQALRDAAAQQQARLPLVFTAAAAALTAELTIAPGTVGENTFTLVLRDAGGAPIEDASRIRLRFEHTRERLGETELRPEPVGGGQYAAAGANLSVPGTWQIRATVQRPGQFDTLVTFRASIEAVSAPARASGPPPSERALVLVAVGVLALGAGGVFMAGRSAQAGVRVLALALCVAGTAALLGGGTLIVNG
jgi:copper transport protein